MSGLIVSLVRHGETPWSRALRHTSFTDLDLTPAGEEAARTLAAGLPGPPTAVWSSPRLRARRTAELAGLSVSAIVDDLAEWNYGEVEGLTTAQLREHTPEWSVWTHACPGGESLAEVEARADAVWARAEGLSGHLVLVSHGHFLRVLAARWIGLSGAAGQLLALDTASVSVLGDERERRVIRRWNLVNGE